MAAKFSDVQPSYVSEDKITFSQPVINANGTYTNPWKTWSFPRKRDLVRLIGTKDESKIPDKKELDKVLPVMTPDLSEFEKSVPSGVRTMWIGHASVLVKFDDITVLTDPIFSERCSFVSFLGPKRYRNPPCLIKDLPKIDAVVISHNHYDHLDLASVKELNNKYGDSLRWYVPMGLKQWFTNNGCHNVMELSWWQEDQFPGKPDIKFVSTPSQHWSKRTLRDDCKSLWCSWCIIGPNHSFYFAGDTGYCETFKEIGYKYGPFTLAAIPIGAYHPRWFMSPQHVDPEQAVQIHQDIKSINSLGIHWGTFKLTMEPFMEPRDSLKDVISRNEDVVNDSFFTLAHGEIKTIGRDTYKEMD